MRYNYPRTEIGASKLSALSSAASSISICDRMPRVRSERSQQDIVNAAHLRHDDVWNNSVITRYVTNIKWIGSVEWMGL